VAKLPYKKIQEAVTFIKASREEAITLANDIVGDAEVHALFIQKGFIVSPEPVGYMVVPLAKSIQGEHMTKINRQEALAQEARDKVRKPLTDYEIRLFVGGDDEAQEWNRKVVKAVERAHGIGMEDE